MVDGVEGFIVKEGEGASGKSTDEEGAGEAGAVGDGDGVEVLDFEFGVLEGFVDDGEDGFDVGAGGDFGDDSAVGGVDVDLGDDDVAEDFCAVFYDGGGGFVAGGLDG